MFTWNASRVRSRLLLLTKALPEEAGRALREEAEIEMTEAKQRTPVLTGALRASGRVEGPDIQGYNIEVKMRFGGPSVNYAIKVHENLEAYHRNGQAKFLESTLRESARYMADRVARRIELNRLA